MYLEYGNMALPVNLLGTEHLLFQGWSTSGIGLLFDLCVQVLTNRGRPGLFSHGKPGTSLATNGVVGAPGTTSTGISGSQVGARLTPRRELAHGCITALGVISERVDMQ